MKSKKKYLVKKKDDVYEKPKLKKIEWSGLTKEIGTANVTGGCGGVTVGGCGY